MTEFKTFPQLLLEHARGLIGVMLLAYGLNFLLLATYFISDGWNGVESVLLLISFLILFPVVYCYLDIELQRHQYGCRFYLNSLSAVLQ